MNTGHLYTGSTNDLRKRLKQHNDGKSTWTKGRGLWTLIYYEAYRGKLDATKREKQLKMHAAKNELLSRLRGSLI